MFFFPVISPYLGKTSSRQLYSNIRFFYLLSQSWPSPIERKGKNPQTSERFYFSTPAVQSWSTYLPSPDSEAPSLFGTIITLPAFSLLLNQIIFWQSVPNLCFQLCLLFSLLNILFLSVSSAHHSWGTWFSAPSVLLILLPLPVITFSCFFISAYYGQHGEWTF